MTGLGLTWTAPPPPPRIRLPPPPPPPLAPQSPGPVVLTLQPSFAVAQWAVDTVACDNTGCTPYDRRIAYQPVTPTNTSWGAMKVRARQSDRSCPPAPTLERSFGCLMRRRSRSAWW